MWYYLFHLVVSPSLRNIFSPHISWVVHGLQNEWWIRIPLMILRKTSVILRMLLMNSVIRRAPCFPCGSFHTIKLSVWLLLQFAGENRIRSTNHLYIFVISYLFGQWLLSETYVKCYLLAILLKASKISVANIVRILLRWRW